MKTRLELLKERLEIVESVLNTKKLVSCNSIVILDDDTLRTINASEGYVILSTTYPTQFTSENADRIVNELCIRNGSNEVVKLKKINYREYYNLKKESLLNCIETEKKILEVLS